VLDSTRTLRAETRISNAVYRELVSVVIPCYNQARYVKIAIESVQKQSYNNYEIIVVDDGSTDNSREILKGLSGHIQYIRQENKGLAGARNTGILASSGKYIGFLDADDEWSSDYLEKMMDLVNKFPDAAVYFCAARAMDANSKDLPQLFGKPSVPMQAIYWSLLRANFLIPSTITMRRSVILEFGLFDNTLRSCEDWDLWLRILPYHKIIGIDACLVRYRIHEKSLSTNPTGMQTATKLVVEKHFGPDDGMRHSWSLEKQRAYGGVYRYHALTSIQRQSDWESGAKYLLKAFHADPSLALDLDLFYDLVLGAQPPGFRGTNWHLSLDANIPNIEHLLDTIFSSGEQSFILLKNKAYGTAYTAIGLVIYNCGTRSRSRTYFYKAIITRPALLFDYHIFSNILKSYVSKSILSFLKHIKRDLNSLHAITI